MSQQAGFFKIWRQIYDNWMWTAKPFDELHAWIWLIAHANYKRETRTYKGQTVTIDRGQLVTSVASLSETFGWSEKKVRHYLNTLKKAGMTSSRGTPVGTILTIKNYAKWQDIDASEGRTLGQRLGQGLGQTSDLENTAIEASEGQGLGQRLGRTLGQHYKNIRIKEYPTGSGETDPRVKAWEAIKAAEAAEKEAGR